jgi:hypothetical protein
MFCGSFHCITTTHSQCVALGVTNQNIYGLCPQECRPQPPEGHSEDHRPDRRMDLRMFLDRRRAERMEDLRMSLDQRRAKRTEEGITDQLPTHAGRSNAPTDNMRQPRQRTGNTCQPRFRTDRQHAPAASTDRPTTCASPVNGSPDNTHQQRQPERPPTCTSSDNTCYIPR